MKLKSPDHQCCFNCIINETANLLQRLWRENVNVSRSCLLCWNAGACQAHYKCTRHTRTNAVREHADESSCSASTSRYPAYFTANNHWHVSQLSSSRTDLLVTEKEGAVVSWVCVSVIWGILITKNNNDNNKKAKKEKVDQFRLSKKGGWRVNSTPHQNSPQRRWSLIGHRWTRHVASDPQAGICSSQIIIVAQKSAHITDV